MFVCGPCSNWSTESRGGKSWSACSMVAVLIVQLSTVALGKHLSFTPKPSDSHITARQKHTLNIANCKQINKWENVQLLSDIELY